MQVEYVDKFCMQEAALTNTRARTGKGALYAAARIDGARRRTAELPRSWAGRNDAVVIVDFWPSCVCLWKPLMKNPEIVGRVAYSGVKESLTRVSNMRNDEQALYEKRRHVALSNMGSRGGKRSVVHILEVPRCPDFFGAGFVSNGESCLPLDAEQFGKFLRKTRAVTNYQR